MPYSNIDKPSQYFNTVLYTGNGSSPRSLTGVGFSPDFVWVKSRSDAYSHSLYNSVTGGSNYLMTDSTSAEQPNWGVINSFDSDGFTVANGSSGILHVNGNGSTYSSWSWRGSDSSAVSNTSGTITSTVSANTTSGFSIVSYTGTGATATVGHGLGVAPKMIIVKRRDATQDWFIYHQSIGNTKYLNFDTGAESPSYSEAWNNTSPTSTVFSVSPVGWGENNASSATYIAYCFAEVKGFSKAFSYTGNGSTDGTYIHLGFRPAWVMVKASSTTGQWSICDNRRGTANTANGEFLFAESSEATNSAPNNWDFLSNGLKARANYAAHNTSGVTYIGLAFASNPFVTSKGIPSCAV